MTNISVNLLTEEQTRALIREELASFFDQHPITISEKDKQPKVVDLNGLLKARPFIASRSTIYKKVYQGLIPHSKQGKKLYFNLEEIDEWLLSNKIKSPEELRLEAQNYLNNKRR